jgi:hypothetical protein
MGGPCKHFSCRDRIQGPPLLPGRLLPGACWDREKLEFRLRLGALPIFLGSGRAGADQDLRFTRFDSSPKHQVCAFQSKAVTRKG